MAYIFEEENHFYALDCSKAIWATDSINDLYHDYAKSILCDVDWIIETEDNMLLVEYKNANVPGCSNPAAFKPKEDNKLANVTRKYYDSIHYLNIINKDKPRKYIYILEYPNGDVVSRLGIQLMLQQRLPFGLQNTEEAVNKIIESVEVVSIDEWNERYSKFPLNPIPHTEDT